MSQPSPEHVHFQSNNLSESKIQRHATGEAFFCHRTCQFGFGTHFVCIQGSMAKEGATNQVHGASLHAAKIEVRDAPLGRCMVDMSVGKYFGK